MLNQQNGTLIERGRAEEGEKTGEERETKVSE